MKEAHAFEEIQAGRAVGWRACVISSRDPVTKEATAVSQLPGFFHSREEALAAAGQRLAAAAPSTPTKADLAAAKSTRKGK